MLRYCVLHRRGRRFLSAVIAGGHGHLNDSDSGEGELGTVAQAPYPDPEVAEFLPRWGCA